MSENVRNHYCCFKLGTFRLFWSFGNVTSLAHYHFETRCSNHSGPLNQCQFLKITMWHPIKVLRGPQLTRKEKKSKTQYSWKVDHATVFDGLPWCRTEVQPGTSHIFDFSFLLFTTEDCAFRHSKTYLRTCQRSSISPYNCERLIGNDTLMPSVLQIKFWSEKKRVFAV